MAYTIPALTFNSKQAARNIVLHAEAFKQHQMQGYRTAYEGFWDLDNADRTDDERQQILDDMGVAAVEILTDAAKHVADIEKNWPGELGSLYTSSPYDLAFETTPVRVIIQGDMRPEWVTEKAKREK